MILRIFPGLFFYDFVDAAITLIPFKIMSFRVQVTLGVFFPERKLVRRNNFRFVRFVFRCCSSLAKVIFRISLIVNRGGS